MKNKALTVVLFVLFGLPIPVALLGGFLSFLWFMISVLLEHPFLEVMLSFLGIILGVAYPVTYGICLHKTIKQKKISIKTFYPAFHCLIALVYLLSLVPAAQYISDTHEYFGFSKREFTVVEEVDTHGGFHGDGTYCLILDCSENKEKALKKVSDWKELPMSDNIHSLMYGGLRFNGQGLAEEAKWPKVENGYYFFEDRHSESKDSSDDSQLFYRHSYNFSIAVYDTDTNMFYYFEFDT